MSLQCVQDTKYETLIPIPGINDSEGTPVSTQCLHVLLFVDLPPSLPYQMMAYEYSCAMLNIQTCFIS